MKKIIGFASTLFLSMMVLSACSGKESGDKSATDSAKKEQTLKVSVLESAYGKEMWEKVIDAYEKENKGVKVELKADKKIEDVISPDMKAGNFPDVILLATNREAALTETFIKDKNIEDITDVLSMKVPGEDKKVSEKLIPGFTDTLATNPYNDGKTYLAPMFYSPTGLFYDANLLKTKGWEAPKSWDQMWELGEKAKKENISLFTYPKAGYLDSFIFSLLSASGGPEFYNNAMTFKKGTWDSKEATAVFDTIGKLAKYTDPVTVAQANGQDFTKNQQLVLDDKAIFMPNGNWVVDEMKDAPRADGFKWGMMPLPAMKDGGDQYSFTFFEQIWMPKGAKNKKTGKDFMAFMYSDKAADIFKEAGAIQPIQGMSEKLDGDKKLFYSVYDNGAKPVMGGFQNVASVEGLDINSVLFDPVNSLVSGDKTVKEWQDGMVKAANQLAEASK